jgi:ubiquinone/menaquinone biosynthesis C-methylase UbiE
MSQPHFVRDHRRAVANFVATNSLDRAMARSVGGGDGNRVDFEATGKRELEILTQCGFGPGCSLIDVGCGSGRLASQVSSKFGDTVSYLGTDVVPELLAYAKANAIASYKFSLVEECVIPVPDGSADFVALFSIFTHLLRSEIESYMREIGRVLRPGGKLIFSYLELPRHAKIFAYTVMATILRRRKVENHFTSVRVINRWAQDSGFVVEAIMPGHIGQSVAVLRRALLQLK